MDSGSWNKIFLHQDGAFYHVYEWSVWLVKAYVEKEGGTNLTVSKYQTTKAEYVIGGFPLESLSKYIPEYIDSQPIDEKTLSLAVVIPEESTYETLCEEYEKWREECPLKESKKMQSKPQVVGDKRSAELGRSGTFAILAQVLSYPLERSTPIENVEFISNLKQRVSALL